MKIFSIGIKGFGEQRRTSCAAPANVESWILDPLSHPEVEVMTERELADLPFNRSYRGAPECVGEQCCG